MVRNYVNFSIGAYDLKHIKTIALVRWILYLVLNCVDKVYRYNTVKYNNLYFT